MSPLTTLGIGLVVASGLWLVGLALWCLVTPDSARAFLSRFAQSPRAHYLEQSLRLVAGVGFVLASGATRYPELYSLVGWIVAATAALLLLVPWQWHKRFAEWILPPVLRRIRLFAAGAFGLGVLVLLGLSG